MASLPLRFWLQELRDKFADPLVCELTSDRSSTQLKAVVRIFQAFSVKTGPEKGLDAVFVEQLVQIVALKRHFCLPSITAVCHAVTALSACTLHVVLF